MKRLLTQHTMFILYTTVQKMSILDFTYQYSDIPSLCSIYSRQLKLRTETLSNNEIQDC